MIRSIHKLGTANSAVAVTAAALVAMAVFLIPAAPKAQAQEIAARGGKGDRLPVLIQKVPCSLTNWPNYTPTCHFDLRGSGDTTTVRIIALR